MLFFKQTLEQKIERLLQDHTTAEVFAVLEDVCDRRADVCRTLGKRKSEANSFTRIAGIVEQAKLVAMGRA